jgi:serine protease
MLSFLYKYILQRRQEQNKMKRSILFSIMILIGLAVVVLASTTPAYTSNEGGMARVWVEFKPGTKASVERALTGAGAQFHYTFEEFNAFAVSLPEAALSGIQRNPNVVLIEEDAKRYPSAQTVPYGIDMVQALQVQTAGYTGSGRTVCIIDSGLYTLHEDFAGVNVVGGSPSGWNTDKCGHGTHVAGTIAAAMNNIGVVGVAPGVELFIVKVFGDDCSWTYSSDLANAANVCYDSGKANIISMSLGGGRSSVFEKRAFESLYNKGVLSIASAGNAGNTTTSYPAGYDSVISVAAVDGNTVVADFSQKNSSVELSAPGVGVLSTVPFTSTNTLEVNGVTYTGSQIEFAALGSATGALVNGGLCDATGTYSGMVVLCERGVISFYDKVRNVQTSGGVAAVIYNNVSGGFSGTLGEGNSSTIPAISLSQEDGQDLIQYKLGQSGKVTSTEVIYGTNGYEAWDGTSMAAPHVSGVAALIWSNNSALSNVDIRNALTSTAKDLGAAGRDNSYGYGLVQAKSALDSLAGSGGGGGGTDPTGTLAVTVTTDKTTVYTNRQTVKITVTVTDGTNAVTGAAVSTIIKTANGKQYSGSGTTNSSGIATFNYKVNTKSDGTGTYTVTSTATMSGYVSGEGSTTFEVQ